MGYIKEPEGVDLFIKSKPLTKDSEKEISLYIKKWKEENAKKSGSKKSTKSKVKA